MQWFLTIHKQFTKFLQLLMIVNQGGKCEVFCSKGVTCVMLLSTRLAFVDLMLALGSHILYNHCSLWSTLIGFLSPSRVIFAKGWYWSLHHFAYSRPSKTTHTHTHTHKSPCRLELQWDRGNLQTNLFLDTRAICSASDSMELMYHGAPSQHDNDCRWACSSKVMDCRSLPFVSLLAHFVLIASIVS